MQKMNVGICFSGIGHWAFAAKAAGLETVWACERAKFGADGFKANFPYVPFFNDVPADGEDYLAAGKADIIVGLPWCLGFSAGNPKACESHPANRCVFNFIRTVKLLRPKAFIMEITPRFETRYPGLYQKWCREANSDGYITLALKIDAADYGSPQHRKRLYYFGYDTDALATEFDLGAWFATKFIGGQRDKSYTVGNAFANLQYESQAMPGSDYKVWNEGIKGPFRSLEGEGWKKRRAEWGGKCHTITTAAMRDIIHPHRKRFITWREAVALMGLPRGTLLPTRSLSMKFKMIASGVDVRCMTRMLRAAKAVLEDYK